MSWKLFKIQPIRVLIAEFEQPIGSQEIKKKLPAQLMKELLLVAIHQRSPEERIKHKLKSLDSGYRNQDKGLSVQSWEI